MPFTPIENAEISKATNRLTTDTQYDDAGNVVQDTQFRNQNFWYDANGRMIKTANTNNVNKSNAVYDAGGQRVATQVDDVWTFFVYDASGNKVAEYGGLQSTDEGGVKYVLQDHQGSSRAILNSSGYVQARMDYTAFGEEINSNVGLRTQAQGFGANETLNQKYALTERDKATGLDHTWFRKHENRAGRWTSPDPYNGSMSLSNPQSFNRYSYVENQPTNFVDPSGLQASSGNRMCFTITREWYKDGVYSHSEYVGSFCIGGGGGGGGNAHNSGFGSGGGSSGGNGEPKEEGDETFEDCIKTEFDTLYADLKEDIADNLGDTIAGAAGAIAVGILLTAIFDPEPFTKIVLGIAATTVAIAFFSYVILNKNTRKTFKRGVRDAIKECKDKKGAPKKLPSAGSIIKRLTPK